MPEDLRWETLSSATDYECPGFAVRRDAVRLPDGAETTFHAVVDDPTVVVLPFTPDGDVVVIDEWRQAVGRINRGLPAGGIEPEDDDLEAAARRELAEETGYAADMIEPLLAVEPANGVSNLVFHYVVARGCVPRADRRPDPDESIRVDTTGWRRLRDRVRRGELRDGRTALAVLYYDRLPEASD